MFCAGLSCTVTTVNPETTVNKGIIINLLQHRLALERGEFQHINLQCVVVVIDAYLESAEFCTKSCSGSPIQLRWGNILFISLSCRHWISFRLPEANMSFPFLSEIQIGNLHDLIM